MTTIPYRLNLPEMQTRFLRLPGFQKKIAHLLQLHHLCMAGVIPAEDFHSMLRTLRLPTSAWVLFLRDIKTDQGVFDYCALAIQVSRCGVEIEMDVISDYANTQLNRIYRSLKPKK